MGRMWQNIEQNEHPPARALGSVPGWVPRSVQNYLDHTEKGVPIRALARQQGCHASTVLRQIRRVETLRDDPLVDGMLKTLGEAAEEPVRVSPTTIKRKIVAMTPARAAKDPLPDDAELSGQAVRVLRRLCEKGAVLAVAAEMEKAVIVRDGKNGPDTRTGVVDRTIAEAMALKGWIIAGTAGRITRYQISAAGRSALADLMAQQENAQASGAPDSYEDAADKDRGIPRRIRYGLAESPLAALARRRDKDGETFLTNDLVRAGERLREDFEVAQMAPKITKNWEQFLATCGSALPPESAEGAPATVTAHARVLAAIRDLGPGLSDVTLRCCCFLEGLETTEKHLGWSARSGKIVLRIALMRLKRHYDENTGVGGPMIG